jgi:hypothetical protein
MTGNMRYQPFKEFATGKRNTDGKINVVVNHYYPLKIGPGSKKTRRFVKSL